MTEAAKFDLSAVKKGVEELTKITEEANSTKPNLADAYVEKPRLDPSKIEGSLLERMPAPTGWRILILPYQGKQKTAGGIFIPSEV